MSENKLNERISEINKLLGRIMNCELYEKKWGSLYSKFSTLIIYCRRPEGYRCHSISTCIRCKYLPKEDDLVVIQG